MIRVTAAVAALFLALAAAADTEVARNMRGRYKHPDPFSLLDRHMSVALNREHVMPQFATPYFWPWAELAKAAVAIEEDDLEEPQVRTDSNKYQVQLHVRNFQPQDIDVKVRGRVLLVEGKRFIADAKTKKNYVANHFIQRYTLPPGVEPDEVMAELKLTGVLLISAPLHEVKTDTKEREIPLIIEKAPTKEDVLPKELKKEDNKQKEIREIEEVKDRAKAKAPEEAIAKDEANVRKDTITQEGTIEIIGGIQATADNLKGVKVLQIIESDDRPSDQIRIKHLARPQETVEASNFTKLPSTDSYTLHDEHTEATTLISKTKKKELKNATIEQKKNETKKDEEINELDYVLESVE